MSRADKLMAMEALWNDLISGDQGIDSPNWHADELAKTQLRVERGEEKFVDWETAKKEIRTRFE